MDSTQQSRSARSGRESEAGGSKRGRKTSPSAGDANALPETLTSSPASPSAPSTAHSRRSGTQTRAKLSRPTSRGVSPSRSIARQPNRQTRKSLSHSVPEHSGSKRESRSSFTGLSRITTDAIASINYALFAQANLSAKQLRNRMIKEFLLAHSSGAQKLESKWEKEYQDMWRSFVDSSYVPHSHEIQRLVHHVHNTDKTCQQKLQHAQEVTRCALDGIRNLVMRVTEVGIQVSNNTGVLSREPDALLRSAGFGMAQLPNFPAGLATADAASERGIPQQEFCGVEAVLTDPHPPAFRISHADQEEREHLLHVFGRALDSIGVEVQGQRSSEHATKNDSCSTRRASSSLAGSLVDDPLSHSHPRTKERHSGGKDTLTFSPLLSSVISDSTQFHSPSAYEKSTEMPLDGEPLYQAQAEQVQLVHELQHAIDALGADFVQLMKRVTLQCQQYCDKITAQRNALDAQATRLKVADDILRDTVAQSHVECLSAVTAVQQLSLELRQRMTISEEKVNEALQTLIDESAKVCFENDVLHEYDTLAINKEHCLYAYMSGMERQIAEQVDVLRQAQDGMAQIWETQRQRHRRRSTVTTEAAGGLLADVVTAQGTASLPPPYKDCLNRCDRNALLKLLDYLSGYCPEANEYLLAALDEREAFCAAHPAEAAQEEEALARTATVQRLLEKLDEQGHLHCNSQPTSEPLSSRLRRLVEQYNAYMDFNNTYARALVNQADAERRSNALSTDAFFDSRTPIPGLMKNSSAEWVMPMKASGKRGDNTQSVISSPAGPTSSSRVSGTAEGDVTSFMPYHKVWATKQAKSLQRQKETGALSEGAGQHNVGGIVRYLGRRMLPPFATSKVAPLPAPPSNPFATTTSSLSTRSRLHTAISASASTCHPTSTPNPPVPPRKGLASYVISTCKTGKGSVDNVPVNTTTRKGNEEAAAAPRGKVVEASAAMTFRDGDHHFIQREREIFVQMQ